MTTCIFSSIDKDEPAPTISEGSFLKCIEEATHEVYYTPMPGFYILLSLCPEHWGVLLLGHMESPKSFEGIDPSLDYRIDP